MSVMLFWLVGRLLVWFVEKRQTTPYQLITDQDARVAASLYAISWLGNVAPQYDSPLALGVVEGRGDPWLLGMGHVKARSLAGDAWYAVITSGLDAQIRWPRRGNR